MGPIGKAVEVELGLGRLDMEMDKKFHVFLGVVGK